MFVIGVVLQLQCILVVFFWFEIITIILGNHFVVISHQVISRKNQVEHLLAQFYLKILRYKCSLEKGMFWLMKITPTYQNLHIFN